MREIKFRVWDKISKKMYYPGEAKFCITMMGIVCDDETDSGGLLENRNYRMIALFYTSSKDKNGKEIYEGDIVKAHFDEVDNGVEICWAEKDIFGEVKIRIAGGTGFLIRKVICEEEDKEPHHLVSKFMRIKKDDKVIGNIYENPELLK